MRERMGPRLSRLNNGGSLTRTGYASVPPTANKTQNITVTINPYDDERLYNEGEDGSQTEQAE